MDFPSLGDADVYMQLGQACAQSITGEQNWEGCYSDIRPLGIVLFYTVPYLLANDSLEVSYITLLLNSLALVLLLASGCSLLRKACFEGGVGCSRWYFFVEMVFVVSVLILSIGFLPVRLSDHQGLACFMAALALLANDDARKDVVVLVGAGLLAGAAILLKQNFVISIFFFIVFWFAFFGRGAPKESILSIFWFSLGASVALIQVFWVYYHAGVPWFYDPAGLKIYEPYNRQPWVELIAYTLPMKNAYIASLAHEVSDFEYFSVKFYLGMTKFYWAVYMGEAPLQKTPVSLVYSSGQLAFFQLHFVLVALASLGVIISGRKWLAVVVLSSFLAVVVSIAMGHTESRYFFQFRFVLLIFAGYLAVQGGRWISGRMRNALREY